MTALHVFLVLAMATLAPDRDHSVASEAIERALAAEAPLFRGDDEKLRTAALIVALTFRESAFRNDAHSATNDWCLGQVHGRPELADDPDACMRVVFTMLRESMHACPEHPIAFYASGPAGCSNARAQRISRDRMGLAKRLLGGAR